MATAQPDNGFWYIAALTDPSLIFTQFLDLDNKWKWVNRGNVLLLQMDPSTGETTIPQLAAPSGQTYIVNVDDEGVLYRQAGGGGGNISGSGTTNTLPLWTDPTTLGDSWVSQASNILTITNGTGEVFLQSGRNAGASANFNIGPTVPTTGNSSGGFVSIFGGVPTGTGAPGGLLLSGANTVSGGVAGGSVSISTGDGGGSGGTFEVLTGAGTANGGPIHFAPGSGAGFGQDGYFRVLLPSSGGSVVPGYALFQLGAGTQSIFYLTKDEIQLGITGATPELIMGAQHIDLGSTAGATTELRFRELTGGGTNYVGFKAPTTIAGNLIWTLPLSDGTSGQALVTDGSGTLSWSNPSAPPAGANTQVQFNNAGAFGASPNLTWASPVLGIGLGASVTGQLRLFNSTNSNTVTLQTGITSSTYTFTLPTDDGTNGQVLQTDGSGTTSWTTVTTAPAGADTQVQFNNTGAFGASANLTWSSPALSIGTGSSTTGQLKFLNSTNSNTITMQAGTTSSAYTFTLPTTAGTSGHFLQTNGSGTTTWAASTSTPGGSDTQIQYNSSGSFAGSASNIWNNTNVQQILGNPSNPASTTATLLVGNKSSDNVAAIFQSTNASFQFNFVPGAVNSLNGAHILTRGGTGGQALPFCVWTNSTDTVPGIFVGTNGFVSIHHNTTFSGEALAVIDGDLALHPIPGVGTRTNFRLYSNSNYAALRAGSGMAGNITWSWPVADGVSGQFMQTDGSGVLTFASAAISTAGIPGGRLTLTTGVPVTTSDVIAASTLYYTPYISNNLPLWAGSVWSSITFPETSLALSGLTSAKNYDVFGFLNSGVLALELLVWTDDTTRATAVTIQDGRYCKSGDKTRLYLGTIRTTGTTTTEDSGGGSTTQVGGKRFVWNMYNRVDRYINVIDTADSWSYTTDTWRVANGATAPSNCVEYVCGFAEDSVVAQLLANVSVSNSSTRAGKVGIGLGAATPSGLSANMILSGGTFVNMSGSASYYGVPGIGYRNIRWIEKGGSGTTFLGDNGGDGSQSGLVVHVPA